MRATEATPDVTVVVPVFRNATTIRELATRLERAFGGRSYELLLVDDASPDDARTVIRELAAESPQVCGIALARNAGQNRAVLAGLAHARGGLVVVMDGDLQDPPEAVPLLLAELERNGTGAVFAARRGRYETLVRLASGRALKRALWALTLGSVPPDAGLFVAVRREVVEQVVAAGGSDPYVLVLIARAATSVATVPIERGRANASSYTGAMRLSVARRALTTALGLDSGQPSYRITERIGARFSAQEPA